MPIPLIGPMLVEGLSQMLWNFGFRHHPDLQTKWIQGVAGLGTLAELTDKCPEDTFAEDAEDFLSANNPELLESIRKAKPEDRKRLLVDLEKNFNELQGLIDVLKKEV